VVEHAGQERAALLRHRERISRIGQQVRYALGVPQREVDVRTAADPVRPRPRRERGQQAVRAFGDTPDGVAQPQLVVGGGERVGVADGDLLLSRAVLVDRLLDHEALLGQRVDDVVEHGGGPVQPRRGVHRTVAPRPRPLGCAFGQVELVLEGRTHPQPRVGRRGHGALQERPGAAAPVASVVADLVAQHAAHPVEPGQPDVRGEVRDDADLADRFQVRHRHQIVQHVDRVLRPGQPETRTQRAAEASDVRLFAPDDAARIAVQEPQQAHPVGLDALGQLGQVVDHCSSSR
jgi:hypothetical protein